jgi:hypothetical protein
MPDVSIWKDKAARAAFVAKGRERFEAITADLAGQEGMAIVAIEPESGDYFLGRTLGQANRAASEKHLDRWIYFVRIDDPEAAIPLPTW